MRQKVAQFVFQIVTLRVFEPQILNASVMRDDGNIAAEIPDRISYRVGLALLQSSQQLNERIIVKVFSIRVVRSPAPAIKTDAHFGPDDLSDYRLDVRGHERGEQAL